MTTFKSSVGRVIVLPSYATASEETETVFA